MTQKVYRFGFGDADGDASMADLLGGKGANLAEMSKLGLPIPPGLTIPTSVVMGKFVPSSFVKNEVMPVLEDIADQLGYMPLWSVRSGAPVSMPGMMDTLLNVGLNDDNLKEWEGRIGKYQTLDCRMRLAEMFAHVMNRTHEMDDIKSWVPTFKYNLKEPPGTWDEAVKNFQHRKGYVLHLTKRLIVSFNHKLDTAPLNEQISEACRHVRKSWNSQRAKAYRAAHGIPDDMGTAINIQAMVFGNMNDRSGSGVMFTRNPANGEPKPMGEFLINAQGEEVVAGTATPEPLDVMKEWNPGGYEMLLEAARRLETHYGDMQDIEFTVQDGELYLLQCRSGKRTAPAAFKIAYDLTHEGAIDKDRALELVTGDQYYQLSKPSIDQNWPYYDKPDLKGIAGSSGVANGKVVFNCADAINCTEPYVLVRPETSPDDFPAMEKAVAIVTATGGQTSHAAVVARQMNKPCVVGVPGLMFMSDKILVQLGDEIHDVTSDMTASVDGARGYVWFGVEAPVKKSSITPEAEQVFAWGREKLEETGAMLRMTLSEWKETKAKKVWVDLGNASCDEINELISDIKCSADVTAVVDLSSVMDHRAGSDADLLNVFCELSPGEEAKGDAKWQERVDFMSSLEGTHRILVKLPARCRALDKYKIGASWTMVHTVKSLDDLLEATGTVEVDESLINSMGATLPKVMSLMKAAGKPVYPVDDAKHLTDMVFEVFGN